MKKNEIKTKPQKIVRIFKETKTHLKTKKVGWWSSGKQECPGKDISFKRKQNTSFQIKRFQEWILRMKNIINLIR